MSMVLDKSTDRAWRRVEPLLVIETETDYRKARQAVDALAGEVGSNEGHPRAGLLDTLATLVHAWEERHHPVPKSPPRKVLAFLMEEHGLKQGDLPEIGSQGIVSEIIAGKRELNVRQIRNLARRFGVSASVFVG